MSETNGMLMAIPDGLPNRERRSQNLSTKLTEAEAKSIEEAARRAGKTPSEWAREVLLNALQCGSPQTIQAHIFAELVAVQMLLMSTLEPLLCGEKLTREQVGIRFRQVQKTKAAHAQELLARRIEKQEK